MPDNSDVVYTEIAPDYHVIDFVTDQYNTVDPLEKLIHQKCPNAELVPLPPYRRGLYFLLKNNQEI